MAAKRKSKKPSKSVRRAKKRAPPPLDASKFNLFFTESSDVGNRIEDLVNEGYSVKSFAVRSDGYIFYLCVAGPQASGCQPKGTVVVRAGCRSFTIPEFRAHAEAYLKEYVKEYGPLRRRETMAILNLFEMQCRSPL